ncbi:MAG TPA: GLUG motif-containing protein, partial [Candidatus Cloacimonadota bacterium]|nr:GLUG motif-containing protein [Candidatus Cloacimonadota bacterium]
MKKVIFLLSLFYFSNVLMAQTAIFPAIGDGTETNPYQIETLENLFWIAAPDSIVPDPNQAARWSSHYLQTANIDASPTQNWYYNGSGGFSGWSPIGGYIQFSGSYNGNEHSISNLYLNRSISYLGLFGITTEASVIQNLGLIDVDITANQLCTGAIVGQCFGQIDNCYSGGEINGAGRTGGLVGELWTDGVITNSHTEGTVSGDAGGLVGLNRGTITDSYSSAVLTCTNESAGGFMSYNEGIIDNCYASGSVSGNGAAGGFVYNNWGTITNSYATGNVSAFALSSGGGFAAENGSSISNCYATGYVSGG